MPGYQTSKVFRLAGSLEAAAEEPSHRAKSAEENSVLKILYVKFPTWRRH